MPALLCALLFALGLALQQGPASAQEGRATDAAALEEPPVEAAAAAAPNAQVRPVVLLWLAHEREGERVLFNPETDPLLDEAVRERSAMQTTTFTFPLVDLEDQERLPPAAVWAGDAEAIGEASDRYGAQSVLAGAVAQPAPGRWRAEWTLLPADAAPQHFRTEATGMTEAVLRGIDAATARLSAGRSLSTGGEQGELVRVRVGGVATLGDFGRVLALFRGLEGVEDVVLHQTRDDVVVLDVRVQGGGDALAPRARGLEALEPAPPAPDAGTGPSGSADGPALSYRLRP
ncbi:MAG: DUF2066 domain-containing protein [Gammaproteobacteria bacterium]|jgi:hypothetical protein|nr:DUF2066 domain-containing protein [Gammaproteobacteria bacterium]